MTVKRRLTLGVPILALVLGAAWFARARLSRPAKSGGRVVTVTEGPVEETVDATGSVAPLNRVEIKPPIQGRIEQLLVDEGDSVKQGQIIAWMSSTDRAAILDAARAQGADVLKRWEDVYKPTPIVAPLSGVVILRNAVVGQTVDPSVVIYAMSDVLIVLAQVDESDIGKVHLGMTTRIWLDAYPTRFESGKVFDILYEGKNISNVIQYGVKVRPEKVPGYFRSQMTANVSFVVSRKPDALLLPTVAVHETPAGVSQVTVPGPDGKPQQVEVKTGIESGDQVEIVSGLQAGDKVLLSQAKYVPQKAAESSPLTLGGRPQTQGGQAPKPRKSAAQ